MNLDGPECLRCGDTIVAQPQRFQVKAKDVTDSSVGWYDGRVCKGCWQELVEFLNSEPGWAQA